MTKKTPRQHQARGKKKALRRGQEGEMDRIEEFKKLSEALIELGCEKKEATGLALNAIFYVPLNEFPSQEDAKEAATGTASDQMMTINTKLDADVFKDLSHS